MNKFYCFKVFNDKNIFFKSFPTKIIRFKRVKWVKVKRRINALQRRNYLGRKKNFLRQKGKIN